MSEQVSSPLERVQPQDGAERTQQIRARVEAATPGPWSVHHIERGPLMIGIDSDPDGTGPVDLAIAEMLSDATQDDAAFLAHAREDVPWLLDERDYLLSRIAVLEKVWDHDVAKSKIGMLAELLRRQCDHLTNCPAYYTPEPRPIHPACTCGLSEAIQATAGDANEWRRALWQRTEAVAERDALREQLQDVQGLLAEAALAASESEAQLRLAHEALTRWTQIHDLPAKEYTAKWGSVTFADAVDDFTDAARAALAGTVPLAQPQTCQKCGGKGYLVDSVHGEPWQACECQVAQPQKEA